MNGARTLMIGGVIKCARRKSEEHRKREMNAYFLPVGEIRDSGKLVDTFGKNVNKWTKRKSDKHRKWKMNAYTFLGILK